MILIESTMKYILTFILSFLSFLVCSQNITITDIPTIDQLPVNAIHRVFRDSEGYMWYGTVNGLCRDDGYHVKVFRSDIDTPGLLEDNLVECIAEDKKGNIWFGTDKGAYILNKSDYSVHPIDPKRLKNIPVMYLYATSDGSMWLGYRSVLAKYDTNGQLVKEYPIRNEHGGASLSATNAENQQIAKQTPSFTPKNVKSGVFVLFKIIQPLHNKRVAILKESDEKRLIFIYPFTLIFQDFTSS